MRNPLNTGGREDSQPLLNKTGSRIYYYNKKLYELNM